MASASSHESSFMAMNSLIIDAVYGNEFSLGAWARGALPLTYNLSSASSGMDGHLCQRCSLTRVLDVLANAFFCPFITAHPPRQPPKLINIMVKVYIVLLGGVRVDELYCSRFNLSSFILLRVPVCPTSWIAELCSLQAGGSSTEEHHLA